MEQRGQGENLLGAHQAYPKEPGESGGRSIFRRRGLSIALRSIVWAEHECQARNCVGPRSPVAPPVAKFATSAVAACPSADCSPACASSGLLKVRVTSRR